MSSAPERKPRDEEIDAYGLTHAGHVKPANHDHFVVCSIRRQVVVHQTSLHDAGPLAARTERVAFVAAVADGVSGAVAGEHASRLAVEAVTAYVTDSMQCYYRSGASADDAAFTAELEQAALQSHNGLLERATADPTLRGMATTLTLWLGVWPRAYLLQVGDSRCYVLRGGTLTQLSRDQTLAQELVDLGVVPHVGAANPRLAHTLSSAIGGPQTEPRVTCLTQQWGDVGLLCSDGLTRHVPDERIRERLVEMRSAREACETLVQDALDGGGRDNITVVVGRTPAAPPSQLA